MATMTESDYLNLYLQARVAASAPVKEIGNMFGTIPNDAEVNPKSIHRSLEDRSIAINHHLMEEDKVSGLLLEQLLEIEQYGFVTINNTRYPCGIWQLYHLMEIVSKGQHSNWRPFIRKPLSNKNLFHVHHDFFNGFGHNLDNHFKRKYGREKGYRRFKSDIDSLVIRLNKGPSEISIGKILSPLFAGLINEVSVSTKLTGEWLIFQKLETGINFLCLALHEEGDDEIYDKLQPFLEDIE